MSFLSFVPAGVILPYGGNAAPGGWLLCNGSSISQAVYPALYAAIGVNWGDPGGGSFNIPDLRGSFVRGAGTSGSRVGPAVGTEQLHATAQNGLQVTNNAVTSQADSPDHTHNLGYGANVTTGSIATPSATGGGTSAKSGFTSTNHWHSVTSNVTLSSADTETRPYSKGVNYIIKI